MKNLIIIYLIIVSTSYIFIGCENNNSSSLNKDSQLLIAVKNGELENVKKLLTDGANPNTSSEDTGHVLVMALGGDHFEIAKVLIDNDADVNYSHGDRYLIDFLMNTNNREGLNLLIESGKLNKEAINAALTEGAYDNPVSRVGNDILKKLTSMKIEFEGKSKSNSEIIAEAILSNDERILKSLISNANNYQEVIKIVLEKKGYNSDEIQLYSTNIDHRDDDGKTLLMKSIGDEFTFIFAYFLLHHGYDINAQDSDGNTSLMLEVQEGHPDNNSYNLRRLTGLKPDFNIKNNEGKTVYDLVSHYDKYSLPSFLLPSVKDVKIDFIIRSKSKEITENEITLFVERIKSTMQARDRFVDNGDGTITDKLSHLMWQKAAKSPSDNIEKAFDKFCWKKTNIKDLLSSLDYYANKTKEAGYSDWRIPTTEELAFVSVAPFYQKKDIFNSWEDNTISSDYDESEARAMIFSFRNGIYSGNLCNPSIRLVRTIN